MSLFLAGFFGMTGSPWSFYFSSCYWWTLFVRLTQRLYVFFHSKSSILLFGVPIQRIH